MSALQLVLNSLRFYWRSHLAVILGVVIGTAVIGGALIVGDSVRESLRQLSLKRLGRVDLALAGERFFLQELGERIADDPEFASHFDAIAPALSLRAGTVHETDRLIHRANQVGFWGLDERLWSLIGTDSIAPPQDLEIVLSAETARALQAEVGSEVSVWIELPTAIPRDSLLGDRNDISQELVFTVSGILDGSTTADRFQMAPTQQLTRNAFVALDTLQDLLELSEIPVTPRTPLGRPARVNACFVAARDPAAVESSMRLTDRLADLVRQHARLADLNLRLRTIDDRGYVTLESEQMILDPIAAEAGQAAAEALDSPTSPVLVYLANELANAQDLERFSMYSVLAGVDRATLDESPFGPMTVLSGEWPAQPADNEIVLNDWVATDLNVKPGDEIRILWHTVGSHGELPEEEHRFIVRGIIQLSDTPAADRGFTPELEGITDVDSFDAWKKPFEMDLDRVTDRDDDYWTEHRATPKGFVSLAVAQRLWNSRYGQLTSIRVAVPADVPVDEFRARLASKTLAAVDFARAGVVFQPVKLQGLTAAAGTTDFSGLFIGFSVFLILAAAILIGLFFRLGMDSRIASIGLLQSIGLRRGQVGRILAAETLLVLLTGAVLGTLAAIGYARLMVYGLTTWWIGAIGTSEIAVTVRPLSLALGAGIAVAVAVVGLWWSLRQLKGRSCRALLGGALESEDSPGVPTTRPPRNLAACSAIAAAVILAASTAGWVPESEAFSGISWKVCAFFAVGLLTLTASLAGLSLWVSGGDRDAAASASVSSLPGLAVRNSARNRSRTVFTVGLISFASFVIVAVAAGHRNPVAERPDRSSGNGGFLFVASSSQPILFDLNAPSGRDKLALLPEPDSQEAELLARTEVVPFRIKPGQEASCLNLYQAQLPTLLGAPQRMIERGGFKFSGTPGENPWKLLAEELPAEDGLPVYPAFGDMNTLQYSLHLGVGGRIPVPNAEAPTAWIEIVGMFDSSIFQGVLVLSEDHLLQIDPDRQGYGWFLIGASDPEAPPLARDQADRLEELFESKLDAYGFDVERVADRLAAFLRVQNTYLTTFQTLGGLGLILGTIGLGTVMLRNVVERRSEIALMQAVGFRRGSVAVLVLWENLLLLAWGLATGTASALLAMTPHLLSIGADVPWRAGGLMLLGVIAAGLTAAILPLRQALRSPVLSALRNE